MNTIRQLHIVLNHVFCSLSRVLQWYLIIVIFEVAAAEQGFAQVLTAPQLASPPNGSLNQPTTIVLTWNSAVGATGYHLQLSTSVSFGTITVDDSPISDTARQVSSLNSGTTYYWRVRALGLLSSSNWSDVWSFTTIQPLPATPTLSSPQNGVTNSPTTLTLNWNASTGADTYRLQVATNTAFSPVTFDNSSLSGTSYQIGSLADGTTYYWRVMAKNAAGSSNWSTMWNFTTAPLMPASPILLSPADGATGVPTNPTLSWNTASGASTYHVQVSTNAGFSAIIADQIGVTSTSYPLSGLSNNTMYHWRVSAVNPNGEGNWSTAWKFMTIAATPAAPTAPTLVSPADQSTNQPTSITLKWNAALRADTYRLQVSASATFDVNVLDDSTLTADSAHIGMLAKNTVYCWRVRASNSGGTSAWSTVWQFSTAAVDPMVAPTLASPNNGATSQPVRPTLSWNSITGATVYHLQVSTVDSFATKVVDDTALAQTSKQVGPLAKNTTYYWHVRAKNGQNASPWSNIWNFTTEQPQAGPGLVNPPNGASDQPTTLTLSWSDMAGALSYQLQVSTSSTFGTTIFNDARISGTSQQVGSLSNSTLYYWRVRANYLLFSSDWSSVWGFTTTRATPPPAPQLVSPANGLANQPTAVTFGWSNALGATIYHLQVATASSFSTLVVNDSTLSTTSSQVNSLINNTTYYWRVRARNSYGWSPYSTAWSFTTTSPTSSTLSLHATIDFPAYGNASEFKPTDYRIVGLPGNSDSNLSALLSGTAEADWIAFWDNGSPTDYLVRYNPSSTFKFAAGRSFWLIHKGPWSINASVPAASLNAAQQAEIPLHQGWNLITNPFTSAVLWSNIQSLNSVSEKIQTFNGSFNVSSSFDPYVGYYFFNATNLSVLKIPHSSAPSASQVASSSQRQEDPSDWQVQVSISSSQGTDKLLSFGVSTTAEEGWDAHDFHKARGVSSAPSSYFNKPEWDTLYSSFAADVRSLIKEFERWDISITAPQWRSGEPMDVTFDGIDHIPSEFDVYLIDNLHTTSVNLRENPIYRFTPVTVNSILSVLVGKSQAVREFVQSISVPREYTLGANYPNPFNPSTTIPVELPVASDVTLKIFSMLGQEIKTLHEGNLRAGKHWFRWDGMNATGQAVPSGTYFYRLSSSQITQTKKMILLK